MFIKDIMKTQLITLREDALIGEALQLMNKNRIRHLPIVDEKQGIVGIVSDRDIREASPSSLEQTHDRFLHFPVGEIMTKNVVTGSPLDSIEDVAASFYEYKISCLPITQNEKLIGIVTETDLLCVFIELTGAHQPGCRIEVRVDNSAGMLSDVTAIIAKLQINIISVFVYPDTDENFKVLVIRMQVMNPKNAIRELTAKGYHVLWPMI
ncbi:MAG: acetoin utilization AcuB family protein [Firmicutes bacterium]|nr:acetoin utilization AcuB family protein [Bacillota bacterium]